MEVTQVDRRPLERFIAAVGVGRIQARPARGNRQASYRWKTSNLAAETALCALWPYLSEPKREQASRAVETVWGTRLAYLSR